MSAILHYFLPTWINDCLNFYATAENQDKLCLPSYLAPLLTAKVLADQPPFNVCVGSDVASRVSMAKAYVQGAILTGWMPPNSFHLDDYEWIIIRPVVHSVDVRRSYSRSVELHGDDYLRFNAILREVFSGAETLVLDVQGISVIGIAHVVRPDKTVALCQSSYWLKRQTECEMLLFHYAQHASPSFSGVNGIEVQFDEASSLNCLNHAYKTQWMTRHDFWRNIALAYRIGIVEATFSDVLLEHGSCLWIDGTSFSFSDSLKWLRWGIDAWSLGKVSSIQLVSCCNNKNYLWALPDKTRIERIHHFISSRVSAWRTPWTERHFIAHISEG